MIKIGVAQWCLDRGGVDAVFRSASLGLSAIQIDAGGDEGAPFLDSLAVQSAYLQAEQESGVEISAIGVNLLNYYGMTNLVDSDASKECWKMIQMAIGAAANMGVKLVFLPSFAQGEIQDRQGLIRTAEVLRKACVVAADHQILIATENTLNASENLKLLSEANHPMLRVLIDSLNPVLWGHETSDLVRHLWSYMCDQIHAKDGVDRVMGNTTLNTGQADFAKTVDVLRSLDFTGYLILENEYDKETAIRVARDKAVLEQLFSAGVG